MVTPAVQHPPSRLSRARAALPKDVFLRSPWRGWAALARSLLLVALGEALLLATPLSWGSALLFRGPLAVSSWLIVASGMAGLFILGHECGHVAFSSRRWVNDLVGLVCMSVIGTSYHAWRIGHHHHHSFTQLRGVDTDWPERLPTLDELAQRSWIQRIVARLAFATPIGLLLGFAVGLVRRALMRWLYPQVRSSRRTRRQIFGSNVAAFAASGAIVLWLWRSLGPLGALKHYAVPLYLGMVLGALFTYLHHSGDGAIVFDSVGWTRERGQTSSTFDVRFPAWFEWLFLNINRHLAHHVAPRIPFYHLPRATAVIAASVPNAYRERRFSIGYLVHAWRAPFLVPIQPGIYAAYDEDDEASLYSPDSIPHQHGPKSQFPGASRS